ncbi:hypothetical protein QV01_03460 [Gallibacterium genomosp. 3]|uniref:Trimeric autotransporter adhesin YadA-like C-terminal membrane anchor domain-containing protein n=1 Tax=Gallibacterium genomosp. 3 TaxID=505345 RepID=A0A1A7NTP0_9PAST|nr:YadA-like family protein [Gallibacterium genomosp. 3]OBW93033.1 hypothetical protein QV01_03460 [Gallibacterium genomosp. 3]
MAKAAQPDNNPILEQAVVQFVTNQGEANPKEQNTTFILNLNGDNTSISTSGQDNTVTISLRDNGVTESKLKDNAVTEVKIKNEAVTEAKIKKNAVTKDKLSGELQTQISKLNSDGTLNFSNIAGTNGVITTAMLASDFELNGSKIKTGTVTADRLETSYKNSIDQAIAKTAKIITHISNGNTTKELSGTTLSISGNNDISASIGEGGAVSITLNKAQGIAVNDDRVATAAQVYKAITSAKTTVAAEADDYITVAPTVNEGVQGNSYKISLDVASLTTKLDDTFAKDDDLANYLTKEGLTAADSNIVINNTASGKSVGLATNLTDLTSAEFSGEVAAGSLKADSATIGTNVFINQNGIAMGNQKISGLVNGTEATDAATVGQVNQVYTSLGEVAGELGTWNSNGNTFTPQSYAKVNKDTTEGDGVYDNLHSAVTDMITAINGGMTFKVGNSSQQRYLGGILVFDNNEAPTASDGSNIALSADDNGIHFGLKQVTTGNDLDNDSDNKLVTSGAVKEYVDDYSLAYQVTGSDNNNYEGSTTLGAGFIFNNESPDQLTIGSSSAGQIDFGLNVAESLDGSDDYLVTNRLVKRAIDDLADTYLKIDNVNAGNNIQITKDDDEVTVGLNPELTGLKSATFSTGAQATTSTTIDGTGVAVGKVKLSSDGLVMDSKKITGLGAGTATGEAVNYDQFKTVADQLGGLTDGSLTAQSYNKVEIKDQTTDSRTKIIDSVKDLITAVNTGFTVSDGTTATAEQITAGKTVTFKPKDGEKNITVSHNAGTFSFELNETADKDAIKNASAKNPETNVLATALAVKEFVADQIGATTLTYKANGGTDLTTKLSEGLIFNGDDNLTVEATTGGNVTYKLNPALTGITSIDGTALALKDDKVQSINDGKVTFDADDGHVSTINETAVVFGQDGKLTSLDTVSDVVTFGADAITLVNKKITGLAAGAVTAKSTDAINGGQLFGAFTGLQGLLADAGELTQNESTGVLSLASGKTFGNIKGATTINAALKALNTGVTNLNNGVAGPVRYIDLTDGNVTGNSKLALVGAGDSTTTPISLVNLKSGLGAARVDSKATTTANAQSAVKDLLTEKDDKKLSTAVNLADLQAIAKAGIDFSGNTGDPIHRSLSKTLNILGEGTIPGDFESASGNIRVRAESTDTLYLELSKRLDNLESATFKKDGKAETVVSNNGMTITPSTAGKGSVSLTESGLDNGGNKITGVETPTDKTDAANKDYVDTEIKNASKDLIDTGIKVQTNSNTAQTVKLGETVQINNGANTEVSTITSTGNDGERVHSLNVNVTGLSTAFTDEQGNKLVKVNGSYYKVDDVVKSDGTIDTTNKTSVNVAKVSLVDSQGEVTAMQLDNVKSVITPGDNQTITNAIQDAVTKGNGKSAVNVDDLKAVNDRVQAGFNIKTSAKGGIVDNTGIAATGDNINPDKNTLEFVAGANVTLKQEAGKITISTNNTDIVNNVIESQGLPVSYGYKDADGTYKKAYKIGDNFYKSAAGGDENKLATGTEIVARLDYNDPMTLANVKSALGLTGNADNTPTGTTGGTNANPEAITVDAAQKAVAGVNKDGQSGLLAQAGTDLNKGVNLGDLQAVAQAGLDFAGNAGEVHSPLGTKVTIKGEGTVAQKADNTYKTAADNIVVEANAGKSELTVKLAEDLRNLKSAIFEEAGTDNGSLQVDGNGVRFLKDGTVDSKDENAPSIAKTGIDAGNQKVTNVKDGDIKNNSEDAVNGGQIAKVLGMETDANGTVQGIGGTKQNTIDGALKEVRSEVNNKGDDGKADTNIGITKETGSNGQDVYSVNMSKDLVLKTVTLDNDDGKGKAKLGVVHQAQYVGSETALDVNNIRITGVADAKDPTDAVNLRQMLEMGAKIDTRVTSLERKVDKMDRRLRAGIAGAIATANLPQAGIAGYNSVSVAGGSYGGENSIALGFSRLSDSGKVLFKVSGSSDSSGRVGVGAGVAFQWK